jgi:hypothetical protein
MNVRRLIRPGIMASALVHLSVLALIFLFSEVHPFGVVTAEPIAVELVTPEEMTKQREAEEPQPPPPQFPKDDPLALAQPAAPPQQDEPPPPAQSRPQPAAGPDRREAAATAQPQPAPRPAPAAQAPPAQPAYTRPEPDVTVKYGVILGLPDALPPASSSGDKPGDGIDGKASSAANIASSVVAKFREHLKTCAKLPGSVARSDNIFVKLRVVMTPQATLAGEPILIEGSASTKALELRQSAVQALKACQPYVMLPVDRYGEWKVLDLQFTPGDFV